MIKMPMSRILAPLMAITPPTMTRTPKADTRTSTFDREAICFSPIRRCVNKPRTRGTRMTFMTVMAIAIKETSTHWPARPQTMKGIIMGANNVEQVVMETDKGTSALARNPMTFDAVPLGQEPRRIMPTAISGGISKARTRAYASSGIIV